MKPDLPYIKRFPDRHGRMRYYYRRKGWPSVALPDPLKGMKAFLDAYALAEGRMVVRSAPDTLGALIDAYVKSQEFQGRKPATKETYGTILKMLRARPANNVLVKKITRRSIKELRDQIAETTPGTANMFVRVMRILMSFAVDREWRTDNPALKIDMLKGGEYRSWTDAELMQFEERWPRGTTERLIYELALGTGQRRGDIAKMTWADIKDGEIYVVQEKTGAKLWIPCHKSLVDELERVQRRHAVIVATSRGRAFTADYLGSYFADAIEEAALPAECVLHGLRKAAARRLAEADCTERQIMAVTGHKSAKEVDRYTRQMDQRKGSRAAILKLTRNT